MEDKYPIKEIKVMEGVYIWKPEKNTNNNSNDNTNNDTQNNKINNSSKTNDKTNNFIGNKSIIGENEYICHGKDELIKIYEIEFEELGNRILALFQSNEDMMEFDPNDYDLIQAREENLELIDKKLAEIVKIQKKMKEICEIHPIVNVDIFDYFGIGQSTNNDKEDKKIEKDKEKLIKVNQKNDDKFENKNNIYIIKNENKEENSIENSKDKIENKNEIVTEIEL